MTDAAPVFALTLTLLTGNRASDGPGWYLVGHADNGSQGGNIHRRVTKEQAEEIARSIVGATNYNDIDGGPSPFEIVTKGSVAAKEIIKRELEEAEKIATSVGVLRRNLGEFG